MRKNSSGNLAGGVLLFFRKRPDIWLIIRNNITLCFSSLHTIRFEQNSVFTCSH